MNARPQGHVAIRLYKVAEAHPTNTTKNSSPKCCAANLCNNRPDDRKDLTVQYFRRILAEV